MLAKLTSKNQLTLPKSVVMSVGHAEYYDIATESGRIILTPVRIQQADAVRAKLEALGINEQDVNDAIPADITRLISNAPVEAIERWFDRAIDAQQLSDIFKDD